MPIARVKGPLYHLHHPRGINSGFDMGERDKRNLEALLATCGRSKAEMLRWLNSQPFRTDHTKFIWYLIVGFINRDKND